jgi:integrase/recombinase XerD
MVEQYFCARVVARLRANPHFAILDAYLRRLHERGHRRTTVQNYVHQVEIFLHWLRRRRKVLKDLVEDDARRFACRNQCRQRPLGNCHAALRHLIRLLRDRGLIPIKRPSLPISIERIVAAFDAHLRDVAGLAPATRLYHRRYAGEFIRFVFGDKPIHWPRLRPAHVRAFIAQYGNSGCRAAAGAAAFSLRCLFRWLQCNGDIGADLIAVVPSCRRWRHASLPSTLSDHQYREFLATFVRTSVVGRRDYAIAVCMGQLGLRAMEVANLMLDDLDETAATIQITAGKTRRGRMLPLPPRAHKAIVAYVRRGRLASADRHLFLRHRTPAGIGVSRDLVRSVVRRAFAKVGGCEQQTGTHILRHTAATRLHGAGADIKQVADILGHRSIDTTAIYAKVDLDRLSRVALPWPAATEVRS